MSKQNSMPDTVAEYLAMGCGRCSLGGTPDCKVHRWASAIQALRGIVLSCGLDEQIKWGMPCYTHQGKNVLMLAAFKDYCSLSFFKGSLLQDSQQVLSKPGENSQAARLFRFTDAAQVAPLAETISQYIYEAIEVEKAGLEVPFKDISEVPIPEEFQQTLAADPDLKAAFEALTPGRRRGYLLHFSQPKQSKTRHSRIAKCTPKIMQGKGFHDR